MGWREFLRATGTTAVAVWAAGSIGAHPVDAATNATPATAPAITNATEVDGPMNLIPINMAEAIIDPFWDQALSGFGYHWKKALPDGHGVKLDQAWDSVRFSWVSRPADGQVFSISRELDVHCADYDQLLVAVVAPTGSVLRVSVVTETGTLDFASAPFVETKQEVAVDLGGARRIRQVTLALLAGKEGAGSGWLSWVGLCNRAMLARYERQWRRFDSRWHPYLMGEEFVPSFKPATGFFVTEAELEALRARLGTERNGFDEAAEAAAAQAPEDQINEFVNFWADTRPNRVRDHGKLLLTHGINAAMAGLLRKDAKLMRLAARYALSIAHCEKWDAGFTGRMPGGLADERAFVQSLCAYEVAVILELAWDEFTWIGREFLIRRLAEEGVARINFVTWKHEYIHSCNQLAWFSPGRITAMLAIEKYWPRIRPYTDQAIVELRDSLEHVILPDGGFVEGPGYFSCVGNSAVQSLWLHARARGLPAEKALPDVVRRCADFGAVIISTDPEQDVIPVCDSWEWQDGFAVAMLASMMPDSAWAAMFTRRQKEAETRGLYPKAGEYPNNTAFTLLKLMVSQGLQVQPWTAPPLVVLPDLGWAASTRTWQGQTVKLFLMGNKAGAGHTHEDKGSFVLEFAGQTFALDKGRMDYSNLLTSEIRLCDRHNMLVPVVPGERACPKNSLPHDIKPRCTGDATAFRAEVDVTPGWEGFYKRWVRRWDSPTPDRLTITDEYELAKGEAVDFIWMTERDVKVEGQVVTLTGKPGRVTIEAEPGCTVQVEELPFAERTHHRIRIRKSGKAGTLVTRVRLETIQAQ